MRICCHPIPFWLSAYQLPPDTIFQVHISCHPILFCKRLISCHPIAFLPSAYQLPSHSIFAKCLSAAFRYYFLPNAYMMPTYTIFTKCALAVTRYHFCQVRISCHPISFMPSGYWRSITKTCYSNILKISPPKTESFQIEILIFFIFLLKT